MPQTQTQTRASHSRGGASRHWVRSELNRDRAALIINASNSTNYYGAPTPTMLRLVTSHGRLMNASGLVAASPSKALMMRSSILPRHISSGKVRRHTRVRSCRIIMPVPSGLYSCRPLWTRIFSDHTGGCWGDNHSDGLGCFSPQRGSYPSPHHNPNFSPNLCCRQVR